MATKFANFVKFCYKDHMARSAAIYEAPGAPGVNTAFSNAVGALAVLPSVQNVRTRAESDSAFDTLELHPGQETLRQRVMNLINVGQLDTALERIESALSTAEDYELSSFVALAHEALSAIKNDYPHEQGIISGLTNTLGNYAPAFPSLLATHDFGMEAAVFGAASEDQPQDSPNTGDVGRYMAGQTTQIHMSVLRRDDPNLAQQLTPPQP